MEKAVEGQEKAGSHRQRQAVVQPAAITRRELPSSSRNVWQHVHSWSQPTAQLPGICNAWSAQTLELLRSHALKLATTAQQHSVEGSPSACRLLLGGGSSQRGRWPRWCQPIAADPQDLPKGTQSEVIRAILFEGSPCLVIKTHRRGVMLRQAVRLPVHPCSTAPR